VWEFMTISQRFPTERTSYPLSEGETSLSVALVGNTLVWFMNGAAVSSTENVANIPTTWTVQSVNTE
jgi:hypothetical protein